MEPRQGVAPARRGRGCVHLPDCAARTARSDPDPGLDIGASRIVVARDVVLDGRHPASRGVPRAAPRCGVDRAQQRHGGRCLRQPRSAARGDARAGQHRVAIPARSHAHLHVLPRSQTLPRAYASPDRRPHRGRGAGPHRLVRSRRRTRHRDLERRRPRRLSTADSERACAGASAVPARRRRPGGAVHRPRVRPQGTPRRDRGPRARADRAADGGGRYSQDGRRGASPRRKARRRRPGAAAGRAARHPPVSGGRRHVRAAQRLRVERTRLPRGARLGVADRRDPSGRRARRRHRRRQRVSRRPRSDADRRSPRTDRRATGRRLRDGGARQRRRLLVDGDRAAIPRPRRRDRRREGRRAVDS